MSQAWEANCMACDPFAGDFDGGGSNDSIMSDKIVTARKAGECHTCCGPIVPGTRVRRRAEVYDGEFMRFGWCEDCCKAMALADPDAYEARVEIGLAARRALESLSQNNPETMK